MTRRYFKSFVAVWTLAVVAAVSAFVLHLAMRGKTVALGYQVGRARAEQAKLREVKRVLQVEAASYKTPERVEVVARTLLGMEAPTPDRVIALPALPDIKEPKVAAATPTGDTRASVPVIARGATSQGVQ